jgi:hypothetical protein
VYGLDWPVCWSGVWPVAFAVIAFSPTRDKRRIIARCIRSANRARADRGAPGDRQSVGGTTIARRGPFPRVGRRLHSSRSESRVRPKRPRPITKAPGLRVRFETRRRGFKSCLAGRSGMTQCQNSAGLGRPEKTKGSGLGRVSKRPLSAERKRPQPKAEARLGDYRRISLGYECGRELAVSRVRRGEGQLGVYRPDRRRTANVSRRNRFRPNLQLIYFNLRFSAKDFPFRPVRECG